MGILNRMKAREIATQRTIALYKDQEKAITELNKKYKLNLKYTDLVREGVDVVIAQLEAELSEKK